MSDGAAAAAAGLADAGAVPNAQYAMDMLNKTAAEPSVQTAAEAGAVPRPDHIPEKFWDAQAGKVRTEDLAKSYAELERKLREGKPAEAEPKPDPAAESKPAEADKLTIEKPEDKSAEAAQPAVAEALAKAGMSFEAVNAEYQKSGEVSAETRAKLDGIFGKEMVDVYFNGLRAQEASALLAAHEVAGGKETFDSAVDWARQKMSDEDLASYNKLVSDPATQKQGIEWLVGKYRAANPSEGTLVNAESSPSTVGDVFNSREEMTAIMRSPEYARDPAVRQQVAEKLQRSIKAGKITANVSHHTQRLN